MPKEATLTIFLTRTNKIYHIIGENWVRSEKIMVKTDNPQAPSPLRPIKKLPNMILNSDSTIESITDNTATVNSQELKHLLNKQHLLTQLKERLSEISKPNKIVSIVSNIKSKPK